MLYMKSCLRKARLLTLLFLLFCLPLTSSASTLIYTFQLGSFIRLEDAQKQFDQTIQILNETETDHLRIEKIGKFYSVRLGKFVNKHEADTFFGPIKNRLTQSLLMEAYYKEERITRLYQTTKTEITQIKKEPLTSSMPVNSTSQLSVTERDKVNEKAEAEPTDAHLQTISGLVKKHQYKEALESIRSTLADHPEDPSMNGWYGRILLKLGQPDEAITYLRKAVELSPGVPDYHNGIGYCLFYSNKFHDAINAFNRAVSLNPSYVDALAGLGATYVKIGQKGKAIDVYKKLKNLDSHHAEKLLQIINKT